MAPIIRTCSTGIALLLAAFHAVPAAAQPADLADYVRARAADAAGAATLAAQGYGRALAATPDDPVIALRAYRQALMAGDVALASRATAVMEKAGVAPPDAALFDMAVALAAGDQPHAADAVKRLKGTPFDFLMPVLTAWLAQARGLDGVAVLDGLELGALARRYAGTQRALMLMAQGKGDSAAVGAIAALAGDGDADARIDLAVVRGREGHALLAGGGPELEAVARRLDAPQPVTIRYSLSRLFRAMASDLAGDRLATLTIVLSRCALILDPGEERARIVLAQAVDGAGAADLALQTLAVIPKDSPFARRAAGVRVTVLQDRGRTDAALADARALAEDRRATVLEVERYAQLLGDTGRYDAAARVYADALRRGGEGDADLHLDRGVALERAGRWDQALPELRRAADLAPNRAEPLRTLGVALIAHGGDGVEALRLLERARRLAPEDAEVADALGWAYVQQGETARGVPLLEAATRSDPAGTVANEHLGDAYWRLGRTFEARYAWQAAALHAAPVDAARIARKLDEGLTGTS
ncbi:tetratricopeptide repeat protein [Sphingomonas azotifigens]|uniref:tetratricopeptide repeat protein n=1 Tax=Sphingomonas azotifigens TaxID=330920 RepID=UPI001FECF840|nr:tetratricopeptide repeat protein [Sphingomonas azotifigens]